MNVASSGSQSKMSSKKHSMVGVINTSNNGISGGSGGVGTKQVASNHTNRTVNSKSVSHIGGG